MNKMSLWSALSLALLVPVAWCAQDLSKLTFEKYASSAGKYTAMFPGKPKTQKQNANTEVGEIQITLDVLAIGENVAFIISFNDYPDAIKNADPEKMLTGVRDGNKGKDGEIVSDEAIKFGPDKLPGRKVQIKKPGGLNMKTMMIMKGSRLYQVMVVGKDDHINSKEVDRFQKSFQLTK